MGRMCAPLPGGERRAGRGGERGLGAGPRLPPCIYQVAAPAAVLGGLGALSRTMGPCVVPTTSGTRTSERSTGLGGGGGGGGDGESDDAADRETLEAMVAAGSGVDRRRGLVGAGAGVAAGAGREGLSKGKGRMLTALGTIETGSNNLFLPGSTY